MRAVLWHACLRKASWKDGVVTGIYRPPGIAVVSLIFTPASGPTAATGVVGCEGVVGVALVMGGASRPTQAMVQMAGGGFQLPAAVGHAEFERGGAFQAALLRYTQALLTQTAQTT